MAAQEFSSPGEHMAGLSSGSTSSSSTNVSFGPPVSNISNVIYQPRTNSSVRDDVIGSGSRKLKGKFLDDYIVPYLKYNESMFLNSQNWEKMMSDTAIRRQMADLKAAGINPILAGRLGGATWHSVNTPYATVSPSTAYASVYAADVAENNSIRQVNAELEKTNLTNDNMLQIARENNLNNKEINSLLTGTNTLIESMRDEVSRAGQNKSLVGSIISSGVHSLSTLALLSSRFKGGNDNGDNSGNDSSGSGLEYTKNGEVTPESYNKVFQKALENGYIEKRVFNSLTSGHFSTNDFIQGVSAISAIGLLDIANAASALPVY